jgi:hypothetical protein
MQKMRTSRQGEKVTDSIPPTPIVTMRSINPETVDVHEGNDITMTTIPQMMNRIRSISPKTVNVRVGSDVGTTTIPQMTNLTVEIAIAMRVRLANYYIFLSIRLSVPRLARALV